MKSVSYMQADHNGHHAINANKVISNTLVIKTGQRLWHKYHPHVAMMAPLDGHQE